MTVEQAIKRLANGTNDTEWSAFQSWMDSVEKRIDDIHVWLELVEKRLDKLEGSKGGYIVYGGQD